MTIWKLRALWFGFGCMGGAIYQLQLPEPGYDSVLVGGLIAMVCTELVVRVAEHFWGRHDLW